MSEAQDKDIRSDSQKYEDLKADLEQRHLYDMGRLFFLYPAGWSRGTQMDNLQGYKEASARLRHAYETAQGLLGYNQQEALHNLRTKFYEDLEALYIHYHPQDKEAPKKRPQLIIEQQLRVLRTFVAESGQETGTVSWQMAMSAIRFIEESVLRLGHKETHKPLEKLFK